MLPSLTCWAFQRGCHQRTLQCLLVHARCSSSSSNQTSNKLDDELLTRSVSEDFVSDILAVSTIPGKGRGITVTQPTSVGQLLIVSQPLAYLHGHANTDDANDLPDPVGLVGQLSALKRIAGTTNVPRGSSRSSVNSLAWLRMLHRGGWELPAASSEMPKVHDEMTALLHGEIKGKVCSIDQDGPFPEEDELQDIVWYNAFGDKFDDPVAAAEWIEANNRSPGGKAMEKQAERGLPHVGLWPHFSLLNHSCLPNAVHYTIGRVMVVRAVQPLQAGEELLISYLGTEDHAPSSLRRKILQQRFGFLCNCPRCLLEERLPATLTTLLQELHSDVQERLMPSFASAIDNQVQLQKIAHDLVKWSHRLYDALEEFVESAAAADFLPHRCGSLGEHTEGFPESGGPAFTVLCIEAAVYDFFQLMSMRDEVAGADHTASLQNCIKIMDAVSRGGELHTFLTSRVLFRLLKRKASQEDVSQATSDCQLAHVSRYGKLPNERLLGLFKRSEVIGKDFL